MIVALRLLAAGLALGLLGGCSAEKMAKVGRAEDACYPGKAGSHVVEMDRVKISDTDFHAFGNGDPLPVRVYLTEDGREMEAVGGGMLSGTRGERAIDPPLRWRVEFKPDARYEIVIEEQGDHPDAGTWVFPPESRPGFWPVPANKGTFRFGKGSFLHFTDEVEESVAS